MLKDTIRELSQLYSGEFIDIRHHLHAHPELSFREFETAAFVSEKLKSWGIQCWDIAQTGVVALIEGGQPGGKVVALRADMDALPILECNDVPYKSTRDGIMHACGHDVHTTCLLGAARILQETRDQWAGTVKLIFQPGEEKNPGGASILIKEGILQNPAPQAILALHVNPSLEVGKLSFRSGMVMASADELYFTIKGKGGHAAAPHLTTDTILTAAQLVVNLQQIVSRINDPFNPTVLSITSINGGNATNVIPSEVKLSGTFRAMNETWRFAAHDWIRRICKSTADITGATIDVHIDVGYPFLVNNEELTKMAARKASDYMGAGNVEETEMRMGAEDFAFYSHQVPACFFRLGTGNKEKNIVSGVHTPNFNIDETAIETGMGIMAWLAVSASQP